MDDDPFTGVNQRLSELILEGPNGLEEIHRILQSSPKPTTCWTNSEGYTLLALAAKLANAGALTLLLAELDTPFEPGKDEKQDLLWIAIKNFSPFVGERIFTQLLKHVNLDVKNPFPVFGPKGQTALHIAASFGLAWVFRSLRLSHREKLEEVIEVPNEDKQSVLHLAVLEGKREVVELLLEMRVSLIGMRDYNGETALHKAVASNRKELLYLLIQKDASAITICDASGDSPYRHALSKKRQFQTLREKREEDPGQGILAHRASSLPEDMETMLRAKILELPDLAFEVMRKLLFGKGFPGEALFLDLSNFTNPVLDFEEYIKNISRKNVEFCQFLKFVTLPDLACNDERSCKCLLSSLRSDPEAPRVFQYLHNKGVREICHVVVPDCLQHPHANKDIIESFHGAHSRLHIRSLDWRKRDLDIQTILTATKHVEKLVLYSSGNLDVLSHWASLDGLCRLPKLQDIKILISRVCLSKAPLVSALELLVNSLQDEVGSQFEKERTAIEILLKTMNRHDHDLVNIKYDRQTRQYLSDCACSERRFAKVEVTLQDANNDVDSSLIISEAAPSAKQADSLFEKMEHVTKFLNRLKTEGREDCKYVRDNRIKVAIIDSGIHADEKYFPHLTGASFVEDSIADKKDTQWHIPLNPHGTKMATLIRTLNPFCHFYAAKMHYGLSNEDGGDLRAAINAIKWAAKRADIISISWCCTKEMLQDDDLLEELETELFNASQTCLIFCATGDQGPNALRPLPPSDKSFVVKLCSCSTDLNPSKLAELHHATFCIPAEKLSINIPSYVKNAGEAITGRSSAATALAAGIAALVLTMARLAYYDASKTNPPEQAAQQSPPLSRRPKEHANLLHNRLPTQRQSRLERRATEPDEARSKLNVAAEAKVTVYKRSERMKRILEYMCYSRAKYLQPWVFFDADLADLAFDDAKAKIKAKLDIASQVRP